MAFNVRGINSPLKRCLITGTTFCLLTGIGLTIAGHRNYLGFIPITCLFFGILQFGLLCAICHCYQDTYGADQIGMADQQPSPPPRSSSLATGSTHFGDSPATPGISFQVPSSDESHNDHSPLIGQSNRNRPSRNIMPTLSDYLSDYLERDSRYASPDVRRNSCNHLCVGRCTSRNSSACGVANPTIGPTPSPPPRTTSIQRGSTSHGVSPTTPVRTSSLAPSSDGIHQSFSLTVRQANDNQALRNSMPTLSDYLTDYLGQSPINNSSDIRHHSLSNLGVGGHRSRNSSAVRENRPYSPHRNGISLPDPPSRTSSLPRGFSSQDISPPTQVRNTFPTPSSEGSHGNFSPTIMQSTSDQSLRNSMPTLSDYLSDYLEQGSNNVSFVSRNHPHSNLAVGRRRSWNSHNANGEHSNLPQPNSISPHFLPSRTSSLPRNSGSRGSSTSTTLRNSPVLPSSNEVHHINHQSVGQATNSQTFRNSMPTLSDYLSDYLEQNPRNDLPDIRHHSHTHVDVGRHRSRNSSPVSGQRPYSPSPLTGTNSVNRSPVNVQRSNSPPAFSGDPPPYSSIVGKQLWEDPPSYQEASSCLFMRPDAEESYCPSAPSISTGTEESVNPSAPALSMATEECMRPSAPSIAITIADDALSASHSRSSVASNRTEYERPPPYNL